MGWKPIVGKSPENRRKQPFFFGGGGGGGGAPPSDTGASRVKTSQAWGQAPCKEYNTYPTSATNFIIHNNVHAINNYWTIWPKLPNSYKLSFLIIQHY